MMLDEYIYKTIGGIVEELRPTGVITNVTQLPNGNYSVTATNSLDSEKVISIANSNDDLFEDIIIISATETAFEISTNISYDSQYTYTYAEDSPYFLHEKRKKANEILTQKTGQTVEKWKKYPLVLLLRPFTEDLTRPEFVYVDFTIVIVNVTTQGWNADQRFDNNIAPILEPVYDGLISGIVDSNIIQVFSDDEVKHRRENDCLIDGNPLPDYLDGIMINFIDLPFKRKC